MRQNVDLALVGEKVVLVPYTKELVAKYHEWMKDPWLQEMTASEPLSVEEELEMQASWREDSRKCTFIVLAKEGLTTEGRKRYIDADAIESMAGDVNLFFNDDEDASNCEIEIMIAEEKYRRHGFAKEALELMMAYATSRLSVSRFYCKINEVNTASINLFQKLRYTQCNYVAAFKEVELEFKVDRDWKMQAADILEKTDHQTLEPEV